MKIEARLEPASRAGQAARLQRLDFFIAGVQKGGTTALDTMLRAHPAIQMPRRKEVHYFDKEDQDWSSPCYEKLDAQFDWSVPDVLRGEATPVYFYWPNSLERIAAYNPIAKIIVCLRHPAYRAHSHWSMESARKRETLSFQDAIRSGRSRVANSPDGVHRVFSYVERGFYAAQIERVFRLFGRRNAFFIRTDRLWAETTAEISRLCAFLGVPGMQAQERSYIAPAMTSGMPPAEPGDIAYLASLYGRDIRDTARLTGIDFDDWLRLDYREPMRQD